MMRRGSFRRIIITKLLICPNTFRCFTSSRERTEDTNRASSYAGSNSCPFTTLGISRNSSVSEVKAAYHVKCQTVHPDVGGSDAAFRRVKWSYEECLRLVQLRDSKNKSDSSHEDKSNASGNGTSRCNGEEYYEQRTHSWYEAHTELHRAQRQMFYHAFPTRESAEQIDDLLFSAVCSRCFDVIDVSEPLVLALRHYHTVTGYGAPHLESCFRAMDRWEELAERRVGASLYHILLVLYTDGPKLGLTASIISESVEAVMERMCTKGIEYDDWTLTLAHKAFRTSPYPTW